MISKDPFRISSNTKSSKKKAGKERVSKRKHIRFKEKQETAIDP